MSAWSQFARSMSNKEWAHWKRLEAKRSRHRRIKREKELRMRVLAIVKKAVWG